MLMDSNTYELKALREMREINIAMRELSNQASTVSKRYKQGVKMLERQFLTIESCLDDGGCFPGTEPWEIQSPELLKLISDPVLANIPEDTSV